MWGNILTELYNTKFSLISSIQYLFSYDDIVVRKIEQNIPNWLIKVNRAKENIIFYENYFIEYNDYKAKLEILKQSETILILELDKLYSYHIKNNNTKMVSIIDFKNEVSTLNEKIFELQKQIEYYQKLLVSKNKQQNMLDHEKQLLNFFYQRYYEDLQCISTYYNQPNNREIFEIIYDVRRFYFDNANTINSLSLITFFGLCYFKYHFT